MSEYIKRSLSNFESAELLIIDKKYPSSIHCVYYSTYQIMLHITKYILGTEWNSFQERVYASSLNDKKNKEETHNLTISFIKENIEGTNDVFARIFASKIGILKRYRHTADYKEDIIDPKTAQITLKLSQELNKGLLNHFLP